MDEPYLYKKVVEAIRQDILSGNLKPGDRLPPIREMAGKWDCNQGTILRAYQELAHQGLLISRVGQGTKVAEKSPVQDQIPLRRALLLNRIEAYLLEIMTAGYTPEEVEQATRMALEHWRTLSEPPLETAPSTVCFVGSHDPAIAWIAAQYPEITPGWNMQLTFSGSLGGLIALSQNKADLAGCHLWDDETNTYNRPFVHRLLPGRKVALLSLARRRVGLFVPPGNPLGIHDLEDLVRPNLRYANRQPGSGTRVWLDANLKRLEVQPDGITGYLNEKMTHSEVALAVAQGLADTGLGIQTAAITFGLDFVFLTMEDYDLAIPEEKWDLPPIQALYEWLCTPEAQSVISDLGGYDTEKTGSVEWVS